MPDYRAEIERALERQGAEEDKRSGSVEIDRRLLGRVAGQLTLAHITIDDLAAAVAG
jgi:hypothetical protein